LPLRLTKPVQIFLAPASVLPNSSDLEKWLFEIHQSPVGPLIGLGLENVNTQFRAIPHHTTVCSAE
jgi:hypothetical protein